MVANQSINVSNLRLDRDGTLYWLESRPAEQGRGVIVRRTPEGLLSDVTPTGFSVGTDVHGYGGASFIVCRGVIYFSETHDHQVYEQQPYCAPVPLTASATQRFADFCIDEQRGRLICVCEDHQHCPAEEPTNYLLEIDISDRSQHRLVWGEDFYSSPRLSPDGRELAWLQWRHPHMPWDRSGLFTATIDSLINGDSELQAIVNQPDCSVAEIRWSPDGKLSYICDQTGWYNIYFRPDKQICPIDADCSLPHWEFGMSHFDFTSDGDIITAILKNGRAQLARITRVEQTIEYLLNGWSEISEVSVYDDRVYFIGGKLDQTDAIYEYNFQTGAVTLIYQPSHIDHPSAYFSQPTDIFIPNQDEIIHAFFYPPYSPNYTGPNTERPPCIVLAHGGPTSLATSTLNLQIQFWTSRGYAVLDVNYRGSAGFGRLYRTKLHSNWGIIDSNDCICATKHLIERNLVDPARLVVRGRSAGGFTALNCLIQSDIFAAGVIQYGVANLETLCNDTHKFESHYLLSLIGTPETFHQLITERSPHRAAEKISCPVLFFHGQNDTAVPLTQINSIVSQLNTNNIPVDCVTFPGEGHGFRRSETLQSIFQIEEEFYYKYLAK